MTEDAGDDEGRTDPPDAGRGEDGGETGVRVRVDERGGRDVVVPMRLYKTVTVFSTLVAVVCVVVGFALLDAATLQVSLVRELLVDVLGLFGVEPAGGALGAVLAVLGLATIAFGAAVYVLGTRFRAEGMGNAQDDDGEE
ncbi:DUF7315 family membrane protein [Halorarum salinum]|uniref:DUF7315 family membrane protein n=1 Tax=Halorarum salinum TaxID=2743089 RepID=UPI001FE55500|nr:hypothetical protein [Halobaculum salinum]